MLLRNREYRQRLKGYIINNKILPRRTDITSRLKVFVGWLLAI